MVGNLWCEEYRPKTIEDCILPENIKKTFLDFLDKGEVPNLLLAGPAGCGKTTVAKALCNELDLDYILVNGSEEGNIDTLRTKIKQFASSVSLQGGTIVDNRRALRSLGQDKLMNAMIEEQYK